MTKVQSFLRDVSELHQQGASAEGSAGQFFLKGKAARSQPCCPALTRAAPHFHHVGASCAHLREWQRLATL